MTPTPIVTSYAPVPIVTYAAPVVTYRPIASTPVPVVTYSPVTTAVVTPMPTVVSYTPGVVVRPKVYVQGQPIRNLLRAITP